MWFHNVNKTPADVCSALHACLFYQNTRSLHSAVSHLLLSRAYAIDVPEPDKCWKRPINPPHLNETLHHQLLNITFNHVTCYTILSFSKVLP